VRQRAKLVCLSLTVALVSRVVIAGDHATSDITTREGKTYKDVKVQRAEPDGILCSYRAEGGGIGVAKVKFAVLPEALQREYGYNAQSAAAFESSQTQAQIALRAKLWADYQDLTHRIAKRLADEEAEYLANERANQRAAALALANQRTAEARLVGRLTPTSPSWDGSVVPIPDYAQDPNSTNVSNQTYQGLPSQSQLPTAQAQQPQKGQQNLSAATARRR